MNKSQSMRSEQLPIYRIVLLTLSIMIIGTWSMYGQMKVGTNPGSIGANSQLEVESVNGSKVVVRKDIGFLGVGTEIPLEALHVVGNSRLGSTWIGEGRIELNVDAGGDRYSYIDFHSHGDPYTNDFSARIARLPGFDGHLDFENPGAGGFRFWNGSVSIETGQLDVKSPHYFSGTFWNTGADATSIAMVPANNWDLRNELLNHANGDFSLWGGSHLLFAQRASAEIGIGTLDPQSRLHVVGGVRSGYDTGGYVELTPGNASVTGVVNFWRPDGVRAGFLGASGQMAYVAENGSNHIFYGGRVGIGTETPLDALHVAGNSRLGSTWIGEGRIELNVDAGGDRYSYIDFHSYGDPNAADYSARISRIPGFDGHLDFDNPGAGGYRFFNGTLSVETGQIDVKSPGFYSGTFWNSNTGASAIAVVPANNWDLHTEIVAETNGDVRFWGGNNFLYHQRATGNVGIGTSSPLDRLHVAGNSRLGTTWIGGDVVEVNTGGDGDRWSYIDFHSYGAAGAIDYAARIARLPGVDGHLDFDNPGAGGYRFFNGSVSIQLGQLDVLSPGFYSGTFWNSNTGASAIAVVPANNWGLHTEFVAEANGDFRLWSGFDRIYMQRGGNIGINVTDPWRPLDVGGEIRIRGGNPGEGKVLTSDLNGVARWESTSAGASSFLSAGSVRQWVPNETGYHKITNYFESLDRSAEFNPVTGEFTAATSGMYFLFSRIFKTANDGYTGGFHSAFYRNGVQEYLYSIDVINGQDTYSTSGSWLVFLNAGDVVDVRLALSTGGNHVNNCVFSGFKISN